TTAPLRAGTRARQPPQRQMKDQPVARAVASDSDARRASRRALARLAPPRSSRGSATMSGTTAASFTGTALATIPAVPSGISELASPSTSSAPAGAVTPETQLDQNR